MDPDKPRTDDEQTDRRADRETDRQTDENEDIPTTDADENVDNDANNDADNDADNEADNDADSDKDSDSEDEETAALRRIAANTLFTSPSLPFLLPSGSSSSSSLGTPSEWSQDAEDYLWRDQE